MAISRPTRRWCWPARSSRTRWRWPRGSPRRWRAASWPAPITAAAALRSTSARPGFLNIRLDPAVWHAQLRAILRAGTAYGDSTLGGGERVNVEFVSANPTGPMHVGHGRGAVVGDALAALLAKAGFAVQREYYINDAGAQVDVLARSAHLRYREALGEAIGAIPEGLLSRRIPDRDRPRARRARRRQMARPARGGVAAPVREFAVAADDGADPRRSRGARHRLRRVRLRARAGRERRGRRRRSRRSKSAG